MRGSLFIMAASFALTSVGQDQRATERKCCQAEPRTAGGTVPVPSANTEAALGDLAVDPIRTTVNDEGTGHVLHVRIFNDRGDDCASTCSKAVIILPTEAELREVRGANHWKQCYGYLEVDLPWLCPGANIPPEGLVDKATGKRYWNSVEFDVVVTKSTNATGKCNAAFGVFVRGEMPDHVPQNNYWWWRQGCTDATLGPVEWGPKP